MWSGWLLVAGCEYWFPVLVLGTEHQEPVLATRNQPPLKVLVSLTRWPDVLHLQVVVSRKTPLDGRLEIPESLAHRLMATEVPLTLSMPGGQAEGRVEEMACTCAKGAGGNHLHHFLAADALKALPAGANVNLEVDVDDGVVRIEVPT